MQAKWRGEGKPPTTLENWTGVEDDFGTPFDPEKHEHAKGLPLFTKKGAFRKKAGRRVGSSKDKWPSTKVLEEEKGKDFNEFQKKTFNHELFKAWKQLEFETGKDALRAIADSLLVKAMEGEKWATEQVLDRLWGKASQKVESDKRITVEIVKDFQLPEVTRPAIEGEIVDDDLKEIMEAIN